MVCRIRLQDIVTTALIAEINPIQWEIRRRQDATGGWSFSTSASLPASNALEQNTRAYIFVDGVQEMEGLVDGVNIGNEGDLTLYDVSGLGEIDDLARLMSKDTSHYQNVQVLAILNDLLVWGGWVLGDVSTFLDPFARTTIDLRDEENLLPQVQKVLAAIPGAHWRYGGLNGSGVHTLDVGYFDSPETIHIRQSVEGRFIGEGHAWEGGLISFRRSESHAELISEVGGYGGNYADSTDPDSPQRVITLEDALVADPALAVDPDYPIVTNASGVVVVRNLALWPVGGNKRKQFDLHVTENGEEPTNQEIEEASLALYLKCIRFLEEHGASNRQYDAVVEKLDVRPSPGNRIHVDSDSVYAFIDPVTGRAVEVPGLQVHRDLRVGEWAWQGSGDATQLQFLLTEVEHIFYSDDDTVQMYDKTLQPKNRLFGSSGAADRSTIKTGQTIQPVGAASDCVQTTLILGKLITVALPTVPNWANNVALAGLPFADTPGYVLDIVQAPSLGPDLDLIVCASYGVNWTAFDSMTVNAVFVFTE